MMSSTTYYSISDLHIGGDGALDECGFENELIAFLRRIADGPQPAELIILGDAFGTVPYQKHSFWIDNKDLLSKQIFSFLMFIFTLVETGGKEGAPVVTVPVR